jgi:hypothetical protein
MVPRPEVNLKAALDLSAGACLEFDTIVLFGLEAALLKFIEGL